MSWMTAILLGIVQGLTEFLPISSSAHLAIIGQLLGQQDPGAAFTAVTQIGTELAVILYFRHDIWRIIKAWLGWVMRKVPITDPDVRMGWLVIIGSIPIAVLGLLLEDAIDATFRNLWMVVTMLIAVGYYMASADAGATQERDLRQLTWTHGIIYGFAQACALMPGVSRSGATITAGLIMGYTREAAARYSFLLAIPAVLASGLYKLKDIGSSTVAWPQTIVATLIAGGVGVAVIHWLLKWISTNRFLPFVIYRFVFAAFVAIALLTGILQPVA
ncbi:undecaprenyl-diphosphate phosphatase [Stomatohabitans albus]|uniref:undecaprenyl-diphosphate phosphatase n=1 Tax=Stomatohabitans albus TaxID=3110766 RepID=UPI003AB95601